MTKQTENRRESFNYHSVPESCHELLLHCYVTDNIFGRHKGRGI